MVELRNTMGFTIIRQAWLEKGLLFRRSDAETKYQEERIANREEYSLSLIAATEASFQESFDHKQAKLLSDL